MPPPARTLSAEPLAGRPAANPARPRKPARGDGRPLHAALFLGALPVGGRERLILALAERLRDDGDRVDLLLPGADAAWRAQIPPGVRLVDVCRWGTAVPGMRASNKARVYASPPALAAYLRREKPDVLLSVSIPPNLAAALGRRLARTGTRLVLRQSNVVHIPGSSRYAGVPRRPRDRWIPRLYHDADAFIAVSHGVADNLATLVPGAQRRIRVIYNQVVPDDLAARTAEPPGHPWLADGGAPVVLAVGRLVPKKDYPTLLRAFARVRAHRPLRLVVLGEGPERAPLDSLTRELGIDGDVSFAGHHPNPLSCMARAAVLAQASRFEGMPSALVEALACGCPVVATDCPSGPAEILADGRYGRLVPMGDTAALAEAIATTLDDPPARAHLQRRARDFAMAGALEAYAEVLTVQSARPAPGASAPGGAGARVS